MSRFRDCPCEDESPDPCPKCGATVSGDDPVRGVCQAGATWDRATAAERERCAKIADEEAAEYRRQIDEFNKQSPDAMKTREEIGWMLHAKRSASANLAGLIRLGEAPR